MYKCDCGKEFDNSQSFNGHKAHCKQHYLVKYGSTDKLDAKITADRQILANNRIIASDEAKQKRKINLNRWILEKHVCEKCGKIMTEKYGSGRFCSRACANSRNHSEETKYKIKSSLTDHLDHQNNNVQHVAAVNNYLAQPKFCKYCGKLIPFELRKRKSCSDECAKKLQDAGAKLGGLKTATIIVKRSKNEIYFYELCKQHFNVVKHNEPMFNGWDADIIIEDIKYAILWNGPWHYKKITNKHSVEQVQNRDKIKIHEIEQVGYTPYIIRDDGKYNKQFVEDMFDIFIKNIV